MAGFKVRVYEENLRGELTNQDEFEIQFIVTQILENLEIVLNSQTLNPGESIEYSVLAYDQAGDLMEISVDLTVFEPGDFEHEEKTILSNTDQIIEIDSDFPSGYWKIVAVAEEISASKLIYIEENEEAFFSMIGNTLIMTNVGNTIYDKPVQVSIGSDSIVINPVLNLGETKKYILEAPDGTYQIGVTDGKVDEILGNSYLTGNVIGYEEARSSVLGSAKVIFWFLGILLAALIVVFVITRLRNKTIFAFFRRKRRLTNENLQEAHPSLMQNDQGIIGGKKEEAIIISLRTGNIYDQTVTPKLNKVLDETINEGARIYRDGNFQNIFYSESLLKNDEFPYIAVRTAKKIDEIFQSYNKKATEKIKYGIGINRGELISEIKAGKFNFVSTDNVVGKAKRIAKEAKDTVLMSENMHARVISRVKTKRDKKSKLWSISKILDRRKKREEK